MAGVVGADEDHGGLRVEALDVAVLQAPDEVLGAVAGVAPVERSEGGEVFSPRGLAFAFAFAFAFPCPGQRITKGILRDSPNIQRLSCQPCSPRWNP